MHQNKIEFQAHSSSGATQCRMHPIGRLALVLLIMTNVFLIGYGADANHGESLIKECIGLSDKFDYPGLYKCAERLIAAGEREHNDRMLGYGYVYLGGAQLMVKEAARAAENLHRAIELGNKLGNDTILSAAYNSLGIYEASVTRNLYLAQRYFYKSRQSAREAKYHRIEKSIGSNLAELAIELNDTAGIKYAQECYDYGVKSQMPRFEYSGAINLAELYKIKGDYDEAERYAGIAISLARKHDYHDYGQINLINSVIAMGRGDTEKAAEYASAAVDALQEENTVSLPKAYLMLARALTSEGRYRESLEQLIKGSEASHKYSSYTSFAEIYALMAENYEALGETQNALKYLKMAKDSTDKHYHDDKKRLDQERSLILDLEDNENKIKLQNIQVKSQQRLIILLSLGILLLGTFLVMIIVAYNKRKRLYERLATQNREVVALRDELIDNNSSLYESINGENSSRPVSGEGNDGKSSITDDKSDELYAVLCKMMKEERLYSDMRITREAVIERLGTNRTYLTQAISKHGWKNYSQFVNSFRIDEAVRILSDHSKDDIKIRDLYSQLGFGSQATFFKTFRAVTGMSPIVFRKSAK